MALTISAVNWTDFSQGGTLTIGATITTSGTYTTGGQALSFSADGLDIPSEYGPVDYHIFEAPATPGTSQTGNDYVFNVGSTVANGYMQVFKGGVELANAAAFPAATLTGVFRFQRL